MQGTSITEKAQEVIAYNIFDGKKIASILASEQNAKVGIENANKRIMSIMGLTTQNVVDEIRRKIMNVIFNANKDGEIQRRYAEIESRRTIL